METTQPRAILAYRLLLVAGAGAVLWALPWADLVPLFAPGGAPPGGRPAPPAAPQAFYVLLLVAVATGVLTLNYPGRPGVTLLALPASLAWWVLGGAAAVVVAGLGALAGNLLRRQHPLAALPGAARLLLATAAGAAAGNAAGGPLTAPPLAPGWILGSIAFFATVGAVDAGLDWAEARLRALPDSPRGAPARVAPVTPATREGAPPGGPIRTDFLTNLALVPLALFLQVVDGRLGFDRLAVLLAGLVALLFVVRTTVNLRTLHGALQDLHHAVAEEREKLATLFLSTGEGIYTVDEQHRLTAVNPAMAGLLGRPAEDVVGQPCAAVCHFQDEAGQPLCPDHCPLNRAEAKGRPVSQEVVYAVPGHPPKHVLLTYAAGRPAAGRPAQPAGLGIGIARDVTSQKESERLRADFVSLVTHELRSPLTISIGYVSMLRRTLEAGGDRPATTDPRVWRYLDRIEGAERHLLRLVNSLLEMARLERPDLPVEYGDVAVDQLVEDAVETILPAARERRLTVRQDIPGGLPRSWTSELYLQEILANLLSNALKYTPEGGEIAVGVSLGPPPGAPAPGSLERGRGTSPRGEAAGPSSGAARPARPQPGGGAGQRATGEGVGTAGAVPEGAPPPPAPPPPAAGTADTPWLRIRVADTGYGMSEEDQARLFTRFFRSSQPEIRREWGTGLGLAFTRQMVDRIGGRIAVESTLGAGSAFTVAWPLRPPPPPSSPPAAPAPQEPDLTAAPAVGHPGSGQGGQEGSHSPPPPPDPPAPPGEPGNGAAPPS